MIKFNNLKTTNYEKIFILVAFVAALACSCANKAVEVAETTENDTFGCS